MSPYTKGAESTVVVTFEPRGEDTVLTLHHYNLPDAASASAHKEGWGIYMNQFEQSFKKAAQQRAS